MLPSLTQLRTRVGRVTVAGAARWLEFLVGQRVGRPVCSSVTASCHAVGTTPATGTVRYIAATSREAVAVPGQAAGAAQDRGGLALVR